MAGVFGIFIIIRLIKIVLGTLFHGYALHAARKCSLHLLRVIWSSFTHLLLYFANRSQSDQNQIRKHKQIRILLIKPYLMHDQEDLNAQSTQSVSISVVYSSRDLRTRLKLINSSIRNIIGLLLKRGGVASGQINFCFG